MIHQQYQTGVRVVKRVKTRIAGNSTPTSDTLTTIYEGLALVEQLDRAKASAYVDVGITISNTFVVHIPAILTQDYDVEVWYNTLSNRAIFDPLLNTTKLQVVSFRFGFGSKLKHTELICNG